MTPQPTVRERTARARPQRFQRSTAALQPDESLADWCRRSLPHSQLSRLQVCQAVRYQAAARYSRSGYSADPSPTVDEYPLVLAVASGAGVSWDDAADFVLMRR